MRTRKKPWANSTHNVREGQAYASESQTGARTPAFSEGLKLVATSPGLTAFDITSELTSEPVTDCFTRQALRKPINQFITDAGEEKATHS